MEDMPVIGGHYEGNLPFTSVLRGFPDCFIQPVPIGTKGTDVIWSDNFGSFGANMPPNGDDKRGVAISPQMNAIARVQK